jgi:hypothetical protein
MEVCLAANTLHYPQGGHFWVYLNWALGLLAAGCDVVWLEQWPAESTRNDVVVGAMAIRAVLDEQGLNVPLALSPALPNFECVDRAAEADVLVSLDKALAKDVERRFRKSAFVDIDPGMTQGWIRLGEYDLADYDLHFTIGEGVPARDAGIEWQYVPPCVALDRWCPARPGPDAAFTTVTHWSGRWFSEGAEYYKNDKRSAFLPFFDLPRHTAHPLELALPLSSDQRPEEYAMLRERGWRLRDSATVADPSSYRQYVQASLGEFSCAKPSYVRQSTAWVSDRTISYLASGKPAIVQHTGPSRFLPDAGGLFRFRDLQEAASHLDAAMASYEENCRAGRALAEEYFDARKSAVRVLERTL